MSLPKNYEQKLSSYAQSLNTIQLPLLSWDIHMQHLDKLTDFNKDLNYIGKFEQQSVISSKILEEYKDNDAVVVVTDLNLNIEFASSNMLEMSGYRPLEIVGKSPKIFQGPETDASALAEIRKAIANEEAFDCKIVNYRKDRSIYSCHIKGFPVYSKKGVLTNFVAIEQVA